MLATLMYHRVTNTSFPAKAGAFERHLEALVARYRIVVPGDKLTPHTLNICLTFDDAYYDFYHTVFPLLKKWQIQAVLAIPAGLILDKTTIKSEDRLEVPYHKALDSAKTHATLCTWEEIKEMAAEKSIILAAHGLNHLHLGREDIDLKQEIISPKRLIKEKTGQEVSVFIYPYGHMTRRINHFVNQHYTYAMRIGSALNKSWQNMHNVIYRINAENYWPLEKPILTSTHKLALGVRFLNNSLRFK